MNDLRDDELWARAAAGEPEAFGVLFERHARAIYNYCFRRTADWALAEDLTSVVFLEAWRRRTSVRMLEGSALPWLYGVATNVVRTSRRSLRRHAAALARLPYDAASPDDADDAPQRLDDQRCMQDVLRAVARLPQREQDVLALVAWSDLSYEEAAQVLGVPVGTVRSRLARARRRLANGTPPPLRPEGAVE